MTYFYPQFTDNFDNSKFTYIVFFDNSKFTYIVIRNKGETQILLPLIPQPLLLAIVFIT